MKTFNLFSCKNLRQRERHLLTMQIVFSCDLWSFHMLFVTWIQCNIHFWFTIIVSPNIFIQPIRRTFNKNTHIYESNAIEIDERENIKYIFIFIFFFTRNKSEERKLISHRELYEFGCDDSTIFILYRRFHGY